MFKTGKHAGKNYRDIRINHPEYFMYLVTQPAGTVYEHFGFIKYCIEFLTIEDIIEEDEAENQLLENQLLENQLLEKAEAKPRFPLGGVKGEPGFPFLCVYTDGACSNNGRPNAKAGLGIYFGENDPRNVARKVGGKQTNNVAELSAIIETYPLIKHHLKQDGQVRIYSDSKYAIGCVTSYGEKMAQKNWKTTFPNKELVRKAYEIYVNEKNVSFIHIKAHTKNTDEHSLGNEAADYLANQAIGLEECPYK